MREIVELLGNRHVVLGREITKKFEEFFRGSAEDAGSHGTVRCMHGDRIEEL